MRKVIPEQVIVTCDRCGAENDGSSNTGDTWFSLVERGRRQPVESRADFCGDCARVFVGWMKRVEPADEEGTES